MTVTSEAERRNRIRVSLAAYRYEMRPDLPEVMSDSKWNHLAHSIRPEISTGHEVLDKFFKTGFSPFTGMWVRKHPELDKLISLDNYLEELRRHEV